MIQFAKYFVTGAIAAIVDFALFAALLNLVGWPWYVAGALSFIAATFVNYAISIKHVFTSGIRFEKHNEIALTFGVSLIGLGINQTILYALMRYGLAVLLAKIGATGAVFLWNYAARQHFVFKEMPSPRR